MKRKVKVEKEIYHVEREVFLTVFGVNKLRRRLMLAADTRSLLNAYFELL